MARLILDTIDRASLSRTQVSRDPETGQLFIAQRQDLGPILEEAKALAGAFDPHLVRRNPAKARLVARLPSVVVSQLEQLGIWRDRQALLRWLSDPDNRVFRTDDGSRLA